MILSSRFSDVFANSEDSPAGSPEAESASRDSELSDAEIFDGNDDSEDEFEVLKQSLEAANAKNAELHDKMLRMAADFDNARKRSEKERQDVRQYSISEFARDLLPVIDAFDKAMATIDDSPFSLDTEEGKKMASIVEGVQLVSKVFQDSVKKHGIERLPGQGNPFNPMFHNAVAKVVDAALTQETVIDEFVAGYKIGERVLRTAMVRVASPD